MKTLTLDVETVTVDSFATALPDEDCTGVSAGGATTSMARPCPL
ncbi:MAG TPA: hypothetical protein VGC13_27735 [Longimicrobium sp.]|jgi:hypothetical protein